MKMGKDFEGACCETCRIYGDPATAPPPPPETAPVTTSQVRIAVYVRGRSEPIAECVPTGPQVVLGRGKGNDLVVRDGAISRKQCAFLFRDGHWYVKDLGSSCGIYVDGRRVDNARMNEGTEVAMVDYVVRVMPSR